MFLIKCFGIALVVLSIAFIGFLKSRSLIERYKKLSLFSDCTNNLYNYIEQGGLELAVAIKSAFLKCEFLTMQRDKILCNDNDLKRDKLFIEEFFIGLGSSTKKVECDRIKHFNLKLKTRIKEAEDNVIQKSKVYQTMGVCVGLAIGILLI